eukprot:4578161-Amphidinium_carterae.1
MCIRDSDRRDVLDMLDLQIRIVASPLVRSGEASVDARQVVYFCACEPPERHQTTDTSLCVQYHPTAIHYKINSPNPQN